MLGIKMMNLAHLLAYAPIPTELYSWPIIKWVCFITTTNLEFNQKDSNFMLEF